MKSSKSSQQLKTKSVAESVLIELSPKAVVNLEKLRLHCLDKQGRKPAASEIIERLINAAALNGPDAPYPK